MSLPDVAASSRRYYIDALKKVRETPEWKALMNEGAFNQTFMTGADFAK
jgi:tripartite-type tricarboxylate transporter receptor subunit TctC